LAQRCELDGIAIENILRVHGGIFVPEERTYWFPAKRYGWGWGLPNAWQGWLVLAAFVGLLVIGSLVFPPHRQIGPFLAVVAVLCALLTGVCWLKGEPPRWHWGDE
jgi:hypothetical protein